ncbi:MAG: TonB-dependent receptor [Pseudomonadota bacterium]
MAQAADSDSSEAAIEEIVVTARNIEESLQDVPVAITAVDRDALDSFRIDEPMDLQSRVPALQVSVGGSGQSAQINLRGVGSSSISNAFDSAIALNFDGISVSTQRLLQSAFFDIDQVAVLKGPQALYFGKAASAGVLAVTSAGPTETWVVGGRTSYELEEKGATIGGFVSGPITDTLGVRLAAEYQDIDRYMEVADISPTINRDRGLTNLMSRLTFNWAPTDNFEADLKVNYNRQRSEALNGLIDMFCGVDGISDDNPADPSVLALTGGTTPGYDLFLPTHDCDLDDGKFIGLDGDARINSVPDGSPGENRSDISQAYNDTDTWFTRLQVDAGLGQNFDLTVLLGWVDMENEYNDSFNATGSLLDGSPAGLVAPFENTLEQFTSEVRLFSDFDGPFNFQLAAFWEDRDIGHRTSQNAFNPTLLQPPFGPDPITGFTFDWLADRPIEAEATSFLAAADWAITEQWELSGGVRYTDEKKSTVSRFPYVHSVVSGLLGAVPSGFETTDVEFEDDNWNPELVLRYLHNDYLSFYGAYKSGFKSGGVDNNTLPTSGQLFEDLNSDDPVVRQAAVDTLSFDSETSEGFELGMRSTLVDGTLVLNLTAFTYDYSDQQVQLFNPEVFGFDTFNAGEVRTRGLDVDFNWVTPVDGLSFFGAWGFLDAEVTEGAETAGGEDLSGRDSGAAPTFSGNIAMVWDINVGRTMRLSIMPNIFFSDSYIAGGTTFETFNPIDNPRGDLVQGSYETIDLNVSLRGINNNWRLSLIGTNLTDEQIITGCGPAPFRPADGDDQQCNFRRGSQFFLEAAYNF